MKFLSLAIAFFLSVPAYADDPGAQFMAAHSPYVVGLAFATANAPPVRIDYAPGTTTAQINQAVSDAAAVTSWAPVLADPASAEKAILADTTITVAAKLELFKYKSVLDGYALDPTGTQQAWAAIKAADPAIDSTSAGLVEQHCADHGMPLV